MCIFRVFTRLAALLGIVMILSGCTPGATTDSTSPTPKPYFRPPAPAATATAPAQNNGEQGQPGGSANQPITCQNNLTFVKDVTIPDGTPVTARSTMDKRWEVENSGSCGWNEHFRLRLIAGSAMGAQTEQALFPARSGSHAILRILFEAPDEPGDYRSAWQAHSAEGEPFGDPFFIDIVVEASDDAAGAATPAP